MHSLRTIAFAATLSGIFLLAALWPTPAPAQDKRAATRADVAEKKSDLKELRDQIDALREPLSKLTNAVLGIACPLGAHYLPVPGEAELKGAALGPCDPTLGAPAASCG